MRRGYGEPGRGGSFAQETLELCPLSRRQVRVVGWPGAGVGAGDDLDMRVSGDVLSTPRRSGTDRSARTRTQRPGAWKRRSASQPVAWTDIARGPLGLGDATAGNQGNRGVHQQRVRGQRDGGLRCAHRSGDVSSLARRGTSDSKRRPAWPKPGSKFHHVVGFGPLRLADNSEVLDIDESAMVLRLEVRARPLIAAVATFRVIGTDSRCVITLQEEPALRMIGNLVRPVMDPATHVRNHRSLRRLADVFEQRDGDLSQRPRRSPEGQG